MASCSGLLRSKVARQEDKAWSCSRVYIGDKGIMEKENGNYYASWDYVEVM